MSTHGAMLRAAVNNGIRGIPTPLILLLEPSQRCNARCAFCYHWRERPARELTLPEIETLLVDAWGLGCRFLYLSGGEPTLHPDAPDILALARRQGYNVSMTTNGTRLAQVLPRLGPYLDGITVSLDQRGPAHDAQRGVTGLFRDAVDGLLLAAAMRLPARVNLSLHPGNVAEVEPMLRLARQVHAGLHVRLLTRESRALDIDAFTPDGAAVAARHLRRLKRRHPRVLLTPDIYFRTIETGAPFTCRPLSLLLTVDSAGRLFVPCPRWEGTKERLAGNLREGRLRELWQGRAARDIRTEAAACRPGTDCYTSCILDISLLANLSGGMLLEQLAGTGSLLDYFWRRTV